MEAPSSPSGVVKERLQAAPSSRAAKTDEGKSKNGWRDGAPRAGECAVCNNNIDREQHAFNINIGRLLKEDYGQGQLLFRVCGRRCQQCFDGLKKDKRTQADVLLRLRRLGLQTDVRVGDEVTTVADKSPMRNVPEGVGVVTGLQYNNDAAFLCAEIIVKLTIEGSTRKVWPEGLRRLKSSPPSAAHRETRGPFLDRTNMREDEQFTAYAAQKRRAAASARLAEESTRARDHALHTAATAEERADREGSKLPVLLIYASYCCLLIMMINHYHHPG
jgi:hypothetical protein